MSEKNNQVSSEVIEAFLEGRDPQQYIVAVEAPYNENEVTLVINDPEKGKYLEKHKYRPFLWMKHKVALQLYGGNRSAIQSAARKFGVKIKGLTTEDPTGFTPERMDNGFKYLASCSGSYNKLVQFFEQGGVKIYGGGKERLFMVLKPEEQFMIYSGKRLFKGMDDYNDIHRFQYDLETQGLNPRKDPIFQIGMKDNRGFELVIEVKSELQTRLKAEGVKPNAEQKNQIDQELRDSERQAIQDFANVIDATKPDTITGYNSEWFDWNYIYVRCEVLHMNIEAVFKTLNPSAKIKRKTATLKLGQDTQRYEQTYMWGYNILDIMHAVMKAQAINSDIKEKGLKYITKFSKVAKKNRVYVDGDVLHDTWSSQSDFYLNDKNGDWFEDIPVEDAKALTALETERKEKISSDDYEKVKGDYVVQRYLIDDLWETEQVDEIFNQASFLIAKILPTGFMRSSTMGTAGTWTLIMAAWSYENGLAVPNIEEKRDFVGGLSRLLKVGYSKNVYKLDYAALYPKEVLTHDIIPELDISGVMVGLLTYIVDTRDEFKFKKEDEDIICKDIKKQLEADGLSDDKIKELKADLKVHEKLKSNYDRKQLPLKILANSFFGSFGAPYLFNWGDMDSAEEITCRGRQYLRLMVRFFHEDYGFEPLVGDTDGFNFAAPDNLEDVRYVAVGDHWKTRNDAGKELTGVDAVLAEFNEKYMEGRMGLDIDDFCTSTINFARKNYANDINGNIKFVGNTIKSRVMPKYIEEFLDKGIRLLLDGKGYEFIEYYYEYVEKIFNYEIPLAKIATKKKIKQSIDDYTNIYCKSKTTAGNFKSRQAHMELAIKHDLDVNLGDTIYYVNIGTVKSHGDIKTTTNKETGKKEVELRCKLIPADQMRKNPDLTTDEYNVPKYLTAFNSRLEKLLLCFNPEIRDDIFVTAVKSKVKAVDSEGKKKIVWELEPRSQFTKKQCEMDSGNPFEAGQQDTYEALMTMEDKEIRFWSANKMVPNNMEEAEWKETEIDWIERMRVAKIEGIANDKKRIDKIFMRLEVKDLEQLRTSGNLPKEILAFADVMKHPTQGPIFYSHEWETVLCDMNDLFKYEDLAKQRNKYYIEHPDVFDNLKKKDDPFEIWETQLELDKIAFGPKKGERFNPECTEKLCCSEEWDGKCSCFDTFEGDEDRLNAYINERLIKAEKEMEKEKSDPILTESYDEMTERVEKEDVESTEEGEEEFWNF